VRVLLGMSEQLSPADLWSKAQQARKLSHLVPLGDELRDQLRKVAAEYEAAAAAQEQRQISS
jgi:hypothetical protein